MPRESGASSTPRPIGSIAGVSGILGRPVKPGDDNSMCGRILAARWLAMTSQNASAANSMVVALPLWMRARWTEVSGNIRSMKKRPVTSLVVR